MADLELPKNWESAARWFLGGTIIFASGFEAVVLFWEGKFLVSFGSLLVAIILLAILIYWDLLKGKIPRVTAAINATVTDARLWAVLLLVLAVFVRLPLDAAQQPALSWLYASPLLVAVLLFFASWKYLKPTDRAETRIAAAPAVATKDPQSERDLLLLLDFAVHQATSELLIDVIKAAPSMVLIEPLVLANDRYEEATKFIHYVESKLAGSHRMSEIASLLHNGEWQAELQIRETPLDKRPAGIDPLDLRKWGIANRQCWLLHNYLVRQSAEVKQRIASQRDALIERLVLRDV
jgi:hypothetical protein